MRRLLTVTSIMICLTAFRAGDAQTISAPCKVGASPLTNHETLTNAVAHELGHSFGLLDCYSCKDKTTVMNQFKSVNTPNHMNGPAACDVAQVKSAYRAPANHAAQKKKIIVDEGEEPVDDDTPIVIPKP